MGSVTCIRNIGPGNDSGIIHEVESINVTGIAVSVIVLGGPEDFILILPHIGLKVRMRPHNALIHNCNYHRRVSGAFLPGLGAVHIITGHKMLKVLTRDRTCIDTIPLIRESRVIENRCGST